MAEVKILVKPRIEEFLTQSFIAAEFENLVQRTDVQLKLMDQERGCSSHCSPPSLYDGICWSGRWGIQPADRFGEAIFFNLHLFPKLNGTLMLRRQLRGGSSRRNIDAVSLDAQKGDPEWAKLPDTLEYWNNQYLALALNVPEKRERLANLSLECFYP